MRANFFCSNFLITPRGAGHPGKIPGTSQIPLFENQGRRTFAGGHEPFGHHPFTWKTPTPPGGLQTQKVNLCARFSCLGFCKNLRLSCAMEMSRLSRGHSVQSMWIFIKLVGTSRKSLGLAPNRPRMLPRHNEHHFFFGHGEVRV